MRGSLEPPAIYLSIYLSIFCRFEGVPRASCGALFMVLERPWAFWGDVRAVLGVLGACAGLPRASRGPSETPGGLLAASWWLTGASQGAPGGLWGPPGGPRRPLGPLWGSPEGPRRPLGALWALLRPQSGALVAPKSSQERPPRAISRKINKILVWFRNITLSTLFSDAISWCFMVFLRTTVCFKEFRTFA